MKHLRFLNYFAYTILLNHSSLNMSMRHFMNLIESVEDFISETESAFSDLKHVDVLLLRKNNNTVEIEDFSAYPMKSGWGSKGLQIICDLADKYQVRLIGRIANENDDFDSTSEYPSEQVLVDWYQKFGFETSYGIDEIHITRHPKPNSK